MKRFVWLFVVGVMVPSILFGASAYEHMFGAITTRDTCTVNAQHTTYGSWVRACSTGTLTTLDSGNVVCKVTGSVTLYDGDVLYIGIDSATGATDTLYGWTKIVAPSRFHGSIKLPFIYTDVVVADSNVTIPSRVVSFATHSYGQSYAVDNLVVELYMIAQDAQ